MTDSMASLSAARESAARQAEHAVAVRRLWSAAPTLYSFEPLPHIGWGGDSDAYLANGDRIYRFPRTAEVAESLEVEARLLPSIGQVAEQAGLAVPQFDFVARDELGKPRFASYPLIPGQPLGKKLASALGRSPEPAADLAEAAARLATFLAGLHTLPLGLLGGDDGPSGPSSATGATQPIARELLVAAREPTPKASALLRAGLERQRARLRASIYPALDADERDWLERAFADLLDDPDGIAHPGPCVCHGDLTSDHILFAVDSATGRLCLTGVIDFGDLRLGDPAGELTWRYELGEELFQRTLANYVQALVAKGAGPVDLAAFARRVTFRWNLIPAVEISYGLASGRDDYVAEGRREFRSRMGRGQARAG